MISREKAIELLNRVVNVLEYRGIEPAIDIEHLRVLAYQMEKEK